MIKKKKIRPFLNRLGGKYRQLKKLQLVFPESCDVFIDVFFGSGCVTLNYDNSREYIANDIDSSVIEIQNSIMKSDENKIEKYDWYKNSDTFEFCKKLEKKYLKNSKKRGDFVLNLKGSELIYIKKYLQWFGVLGEGESIIKDTTLKKTNPVPLANYYQHQKTLIEKKVTFYNLDYKEFLETLIEKGYFLDRRKYFIYFDPPFTMKANYDRYNNNKIDFNELFYYLNLLCKPNIFWCCSLQEKDVMIMFGDKKEYCKEKNIRQFSYTKKEGSDNLQKGKENKNVKPIYEYLIFKRWKWLM